ncbi:MAG: AraC family transcriptional regulator [Ruminococcaceae bacterium]|nr:AraC family transcriptional regulator [Oscillospiraceae bacterium]
MKQTKAHPRRRSAMNKLKIPAITSPMEAEILWLQMQYRHLDDHRVSKKLHRHTFYEIHFQRKDHTVYQIAEWGEVTLSEGEYLLFPPGTEHVMSSGGAEYERLSLTFVLNGGEDNPVYAAFPKNVTHGKITEGMEAAIRIALSAEGCPRAVIPYLIRESVCALLLMLSSSPKEKSGFAERGVSRAEASDDGEDVRLIHARKFIEDNSTRPLSVTEAAQVVHLSDRQLNRLFNEAEGVSVGEYIRKARCERMKELLTGTELTIREIAEALGFSNEYNCIRFFESAEGVSPGQYRRLAQ